MANTEQMREAVARAIWNIRREDEDRCDLELEDMGKSHSVWREADAALAAASAEAQPSQEPVADEIKRITHERDALAAAIRDAAVSAGICRADANLTGPHLLMLCADMANCITAHNPQPSAPVAQEWITREQAMRMVATGLPTADLIKQAFGMGAALRLDQFSPDNLTAIARSESVTAMRNALTNVAKALKAAPQDALTDAQVVGYVNGDELANATVDAAGFIKLRIVEKRNSWYATPLSAAPQVEAKEGWKLVPTQITEEMHAAAVRTIQRCTGNDDFPRRVFAAMLAAAPSSQKEGEQP